MNTDQEEQDSRRIEAINNGLRIGARAWEAMEPRAMEYAHGQDPLGYWTGISAAATGAAAAIIGRQQTAAVLRSLIAELESESPAG